MNNNKLGCLLVFIIIIVALYFALVKDSPTDKKAKAEVASKLVEYKSKFDYDVDSIAKTINMAVYEPNLDEIKGKCLIVDTEDDKYVVNLILVNEKSCRFPDEYIAYKHKDLNTIIICKFDLVSISDWGKSSVSQEQVDLSFYDVNSKKVLYKTKIVGNGKPYIVERGRMAGAKTYFLNYSDLINEILTLINHKN